MNETWKFRSSRRRFLRSLALAATVAPLAAITVHSRPARADREPLDEADDAARAVAYVHDAAEADDPAYEEGQTCGNCALYSHRADGWGGCAAFPGRLVSEDGWCNIWVAAD